MYFPDRGCVRTLHTLYVYATEHHMRSYRDAKAAEILKKLRMWRLSNVHVDFFVLFIHKKY